ncbi:MAG: metallophosphoesterase [Chloroflexota bacterium]
MYIGLIGDLHGHVFETLAAIAIWQNRIGRQFDLLIQAGDLGAYPDLAKLDPDSVRHMAADPAIGDFSRFLTIRGRQKEALHTLRNQFKSPIYFLRGNHEDFDWLKQLSLHTEPDGGINAMQGTAQVDPFNFYRYVPDNTVLQFVDNNGQSLAIGFLGGVEELTGPPAFDPEAYVAMLARKSGSIDILIAHEGPYGSSIGYHGDTHGSQMITRLIEHLKPPFLVAGHAHCLSGPAMYDETLYLGLNIIRSSALWYPEATGLQPGWIGILDTDASTLEPVTDAWLTEFDTPFSFDEWWAKFR